ncbi:hypothetical protein ACFL6S_26835 [Candidatus Poribacteria bacterium]
MKNAKPVYALILVLILTSLMGCVKGTSVIEFVKEGGLESKGLVNLALPDSGARIMVSQDNPSHPASTLNNGITSSENWDQGEGWESEYSGRFSRGRYLVYGAEDPYMAEERGFDGGYDAGDVEWRGLRIQSRGGRSTNTALGWAIVEFPEKKLVNRAVIYTIDSQKYPASKFGVRDVAVQYWNDVIKTWASAERLGRAKGQTANAIQDNEKGVMNFRFEPVETSKMRFVVRWTNDSQERRLGYYMHGKGTIRLTEIEVYGYEKEELDEEAIAVVVAQDANKVAEINVVIDNYVDGYNRRNVDVLMSSVSEDYSRNGETYLGLWDRMESMFVQYEQVKLELKDIQVALTDKGATAKSTYSSHYKTTEGKAHTAAGTLAFQLSKSTGHWKITRIDSQ